MNQFLSLRLPTVCLVVKQVRSKLGPNAAKLGPKACTMTQNKARRTNKIDFLQLPWAQEASGSNPDAPTKSPNRIIELACCPFRCLLHCGASREQFRLDHGEAGLQEEAQLDRLLDPKNVSVMLNMIAGAARTVSKGEIIRLADVMAKGA